MTAVTRAQVGSPVQRQAVVRWATTAVVLLVIVFLEGERLGHLIGPGRPVLAQALVTGLLLGGVYGLVSMGLSLIFGVLHIINFAHGALMTVGMYASFLLVASTGLDPYATIVVSVALLFVIGMAVQKVLVNRIMGQPLENQLLLTLGLAIFIENALLLAFTATPRAIQLPYARGTLSLGLVELHLPFRVFGAVASLPPVAMRSPSGLEAIVDTSPVCPENVVSCFPDPVSQLRAVPSLLAVTTHVPSGPNARSLTSHACPLRDTPASPVRRSQILAGSHRGAARRAPSGLKTGRTSAPHM